MIVLTHAVLGVLYACIVYIYTFFGTCSPQVSMFHMERRSRNTIIIIIIIIITITSVYGLCPQQDVLV